MKIILLIFLSLFITNANAQLTAFVSHRQFFLKNNSELLHDICIKTYPNKSFTMQFDYFIADKKTDSFTVYCTSEKSKFFNNYWHYTLSHRLTIANYTCNISIIENSTNDKMETSEAIEMMQIDTLGLSPISLFIADSSSSFLPICFENFCDTYVNNIIAKTNIMHFEKTKEKIYLYLRIAKKNKPNFIFYSDTDSMDYDIAQQKNVMPYQFNIPLNSLISGNYIASISLFEKTKQISKTQISFQCVRPFISKAPKSVQIEEDFMQGSDNQFAQSFVAKYDDVNLKRNLLSLQAIVSPNQFNVIQQIAEGKDDTLARRYFYNFWVNKNNAYPEKEWKDYLVKLNECVKSYGGIATDQAFIYLRYGKADKVETILSEINTIPYEIWQYEAINSHQNVVFLFVQRNGVNNQMNLIHSTHPQEKKMMQWQQFLIKGEAQNNRVFEYLAPDGKSR
jgi:GWxTD domain-containing protein